jgi:hypothetical protein
MGLMALLVEVPCFSLRDLGVGVCGNGEGGGCVPVSNMVEHVGIKGANLMGAELYNNLQQYLKRHLMLVKEKGSGLIDDPLLHYYVQEWQRYNIASTYIHHVFRYLNRHWVRREIDEGHNRRLSGTFVI